MVDGYYSNYLITLLGNGDGTFGAPIYTGGDSEVLSVTLADMNGDGKLDAILAGYGALEVAFGKGDGTFTSVKVPACPGLNVGLGRGVPRDDLKHGLDRDTAQARFEEGVEILQRAWREDTFTYSGKAWNYVDITCRPKPLQRPHPPIYYGATSPESPSMVARRGWNLALSRQPLANCAKAIAKYRAERAALETPPGGGDAIMVRDIYIAETDEQAWAEAAPEITRFWQLATDNVWRGNSITTDDLPRFTERFAYFPGGLTVKRMDEWGTSLIGNPETVLKKARQMIETARPDCLVGMFSFGGLSHEQVMRSIELFATKVLPRVANPG